MFVARDMSFHFILIYYKEFISRCRKASSDESKEDSNIIKEREAFVLRYS